MTGRRPVRPRRVRALGVLLGAALGVALLAGCGGADGGTAEGGEPGGASQSTGDAGAAAPAAEAVLDPDDWLLELDEDEQPGYDVSLCHALAVSQYDAIPSDEDDYLSITADGSSATLLSSDAATPEGLLEVAQCFIALRMGPEPAIDLVERISKDRIDGSSGQVDVGDVGLEWRWEGLVLGLRFSA